MDINQNFVVFPCPKCYLCYQDYKNLLEHLYWRHGTESVWCSKCNLKRWVFAEHKCHVLPIYEEYVIEFVDKANDTDDTSDTNHIINTNDTSVRESQYCYCGKDIDEPMIGCDEPRCQLQWYHYKCVGVEVPPEGTWFCPECSKARKKRKK